MSDIIEDRLQHLADDGPTLKALHFIFNQRIEKEKPEISQLDKNDLIGEKYRAYEQAKMIITEVFTDIDSYRERKVGSEQYNKGK
jgi:hypothetical protein